jgi:predicted lactoylglutathione lyase
MTVRFEGVSPILVVRDLAASRAYYIDILGFQVDWNYEDVMTCVSRDRCSIFLTQGDQGHPGTWIWIGVTDCKALHDELAARGAKIRHPPANYPWALEMQVEDLDGNVLRMGSEPLADAPRGEWLDASGVRWRQIDEHRLERVEE